MGGWSCADRELIEWDGTIRAKNFLYTSGSLDSRFVNVTGDTMTGTLTMNAQMINNGAITTNATNTFNVDPIININSTSIYGSLSSEFKSLLSDAANVTTTETTVWEAEVANFFLKAGDGIRFIVSGLITTSVNNKRIRVYFGDSSAPVLIYDSTAQNPLVTTSFVLEGGVTSITADPYEQRTWTRLNTTGGNLFSFCEVATTTLDTTSSTPIVRITATGGASGEITVKQGRMSWSPQTLQ